MNERLKLRTMMLSVTGGSWIAADTWFDGHFPVAGKRAAISVTNASAYFVTFALLGQVTPRSFSA